MDGLNEHQVCHHCETHGKCRHPKPEECIFVEEHELTERRQMRVNMAPVKERAGFAIAMHNALENNRREI